MSPPHSRLLPIMATLGAMAAYQVGAAFAKDMFPTVGAQGAATLRLGLGALMLIAVVRPWRAWPAPAPLGSMLGLGFALALTITMFFLAIERLPLGVAVALQFLGPLAVAVAGSRRAVDLVWAAFAAFGVWSLVAVGDIAKPLDPIGIALALTAACGWAAYILFGRRASAGFGASTAALATSVAALLVLPFGVHEAGAALLSPSLIPMALLVALFSAAIPFSLELYAMPRLPARTFAVFMSLEPAFAVLAGLAILDERLALAQVVGVAVVMTAAAGAAWSATRSRADLLLPASRSSPASRR